MVELGCDLPLSITSRWETPVSFRNTGPLTDDENCCLRYKRPSSLRPPPCGMSVWECKIDAFLWKTTSKKSDGSAQVYLPQAATWRGVGIKYNSTFPPRSKTIPVCLQHSFLWQHLDPKMLPVFAALKKNWIDRFSWCVSAKPKKPYFCYYNKF